MRTEITTEYHVKCATCGELDIDGMSLDGALYLAESHLDLYTEEDGQKNYRHQVRVTEYRNITAGDR